MKAHLFNHALVLTCCGLLIGGCASTAPLPANTPMAAVVIMKFQSFEPKTVTINAGGTVRWVNKSWISHTVTCDPSRARNQVDVSLPLGADPFNSGQVDPGESYQRTFTVPGTYRYFCIPHETAGMVGEIIVNPAAGSGERTK